MQLEIRRIILFTSDMAGMARFYREVLGLKPLNDEDDWKEFSAGTCDVALHRGNSAGRGRSPKIAFYAADVAAARAVLVRRGAAMGKIMSGRNIDFCDGKDLDGNTFTISSRR
jgi:catechol 2,3-dioxygenase-like lactoylglutathione lyase family enzyme